MEYRHVNGPVYCRYAFTPPVINSKLAYQYGIEAPSILSLDVGSNVKLRLLLADGKKRITCHAIIDWVNADEATGEFKVGLSNLSLTDEEFEVLIDNFVDAPKLPLEFGESVRDKGLESEPVIGGERVQEIKRIKAVTLPVSVIEDIDAKRGDHQFSAFVTNALREYLKR